ncbi:hypothetical protein BGM09_04820 [Streptomyces sp. CBMA29]|nr:hypothetical protein [Streptomyces sp. CBMA29]
MAVCVVGAPAAHAADSITVSYANSVSGDLGTLQVKAEASSDITALTAHIVSPTTGQEVGLVGPEDFVLFSGTAQDGLWRTRTPLHLPDFASYQVDIEASDSAGDHVSVPRAGGLSYFVVADLSDVAVDRTSVDSGHRDVTLSGTLRGRWPDSGELRALPGHTVYVSVSYPDDWLDTSAVSDAQGRISLTLPLGNSATIQAYYRPDNTAPNALYGESPQIAVGIEKTPTRAVLHTSPSRIDLNQQVTLTGRLEQLTDGVWQPLPDVSGGILFGPSAEYNDLVGGFTTSADGSFRADYTPPESGFFQVTSLSADPFISDTVGRSDVVTVLQPARFTDYSAYRLDRHHVRTEGHIAFDGNITPATADVALQFSADGTHWKTLSTVEARWDGSGEYGFSADVTKTRAGYFRARFDGADTWQTVTTGTVQVASA